MNRASFQTIGPLQVKSYLRRSDVQVIDLRDTEEYEQLHLKGAVSIPYETLMKRLDEVDAARTVLLYCTHGSVSIKAAKLLADRGYRTATLAGGICALKEETLRGRRQ